MSNVTIRAKGDDQAVVRHGAATSESGPWRTELAVTIFSMPRLLVPSLRPCRLPILPLREASRGSSGQDKASGNDSGKKSSPCAPISVKRLAPNCARRGKIVNACFFSKNFSCPPTTGA